VIVSAVILGQSWKKYHELADSKTLKPSEREELFHIICGGAKGVSTVLMPAFEVDRLNVLEASMVGMKKAVERLHPKADYVLIDGNKYPEINLPGKALVKGDLYCASIAAASIVAKVVRDRVMRGLDYLYNGWGFAKHKGYPTKMHRDLLEKKSPSIVHRRSFQNVGSKEDFV
jgi:ribonuclease HII